MSFTTDIKNELAAIYPKSACCRRSIGAGLGFCAEQNNTGRVLSIKSSNDAICEFTAKMLHEKYKTDVECICSTARGRRTDMLNFTVSEGRRSDGNPRETFRCPACAAAFVRGVFVAAGSVSDPASCYHAEFIFEDAVRAKVIFEILSELGCPPKIVDRPKGIGLYYKNSEAIEALLVTIGANNSAFRVMNCKIEREIRNSENRATNCVAKNISKAVEASRRHIADIETLMAAGKFDALPYDIRLTARLRLDYPDIPLVELAALHVPPISKSGLNHRLSKISEEAKKIIDK
ncbi:MAG: DNA-binding protein WhiA [Clostridia bacterium]|nr:DNA-binding protein WhiA [Clostridia bacterium]